MDALATVFLRGVCSATTVLESCKFHLFPILMRQFIWETLRFCAFMMVALIVLGGAAQFHPRVESKLFATPWSYGHTYLRIPEFLAHTDIESLDIVILGSSTCYRGINPYHFAEANLSGFNLCSSSQSLFNSKHLLN